MPSLSTRNGPIRRWPVRTILFAIVFALLIPGIVFGAILLQRIATAERTRAQDAARGISLRIADSLDRELGSLTAALIALAASPALDTPAPTPADIAAFGRQARPVALALGHDIVLVDQAGQLLVDTSQPQPAPLQPRLGDGTTLDQAIRTRAPAISGLSANPSGGPPTLTLLVPEIRAGEVLLLLGIRLGPDGLSRLLAVQNFPPGWSAGILDGRGNLIGQATSTEPAQTPAPIRIDEQGVRNRIAGDSALWFGKAIDRTPLLSAMQRQALADWRVVVSLPVSLIEAPLRGTVILLAATGVAAMLLASLLAWRLASSVATPLRHLAASGTQGPDQPVRLVASAIAEVDAVSRALVQATRDLHARADALARERAQLAAVIDTVPVGIVIADPAGRITASNRFISDLLERPMAPEDGDGTRLTAHHADGRVVRPEEYPLQRVLAGEPTAELQCRGTRPNGTSIWLQLVAAPISAEGALTGVVVAVLDIDATIRARETLARSAELLETQVADRTAALTDANTRLRAEMEARAAAEEQLRQAQKMEAVGQLTGGIAHDFNNLLTIVMGSLDLLRRRAPDDRARRLIDNALEGSARAATLTARLLAFSRRQPLVPQSLDVNALLHGMDAQLRRTLGDAIPLALHLAEPLWLIHADPNQLENALLNLAANARDAILAPTPGQDPRTGPAATLSITTTQATLALGFSAPGVSATDPDFEPGDYVRLDITDTGPGMPDDVAGRVFEPFFTTKPIGKGTGLGLSQVHGFVKQTGGHIHLATHPGRGTTVTIHLPRLLEPATVTPPDPAETDPATSATGLTILVVEDEAKVRSYSAEALRELGHAVLEAADAAAALHLLETRPGIDLLFTDVMLPKMNGGRLAAEARTRRPGLPVLLTSGYAATRANADQGQLDAPILQKPFTMQALADSLAACLTPRPEPPPTP